MAHDQRYISVGLSLAPNDISGYNTCPRATAGCKACCIFKTGNGFYPNVTQKRIWRTKLFFENRHEFINLLNQDMQVLVKYAKKEGKPLACRLNVFSDIKFYKILPKEFFTTYSNVQFYDYTKVESTMTDYMEGKLPTNYHMTFSASEENGLFCEDVLNRGFNVSKVFALTRTQWGKCKPAEFTLGTVGKTHKVLDGEASDLRFLDDSPAIVGLYAKGRALSDTFGFVERKSMPLSNRSKKKSIPLIVI